MCNENAEQNSDNHSKRKYWSILKEFFARIPLLHESSKWIAAPTASTIMGLVSIASLWPKSHGLALLAGVIAIPLGWYTISFRSYAVVLLISVLVASTVWFRVGPIVEEAPTPHWIVAADDPTPDNACGKDFKEKFGDDALLLVLGSDSVIGPMPVPMQVGGCSLSMNWNRSGMGITSEIYDRSGALIGILQNNRFQALSDKTLETTIVDTKNSITILDTRDGSELFYAHFINPNVIRVRGSFTCPRPNLSNVQLTNNRTFFNGQAASKHNCYAGTPIGLQF